MKVLVRLLAVISCIFIFSSQAQARGQAYEETYHIGLTAGNIDGGTDFGSVEATGFTIAARNQKASLEYVNMSSKDGDILGGGIWEAKLSGFYLALIGQGQPYMKFKVGKLKHEMIQTIGAALPDSTTESITSYGLGFGYKMGSRAMLEFDITTLDQDMTLFTLTVLF